MRKVLVIGSGLSGTSVTVLLASFNYQVTITDQKRIQNKQYFLDLGVEVFDEGHPDHLLSENWLFVVKNPGISYQEPFIKSIMKNNVIVSEIEVALKYAKNYNFFAITGSNGKTTTTLLLFEMLKRGSKKALCAGNIGIPLSEVVFEHGDIESNVAFEISAFQLKATPSFKPKVAVITNLSPDHLDYYLTVDDYYRDKLLIYQNMDATDYFLLNLDDEVLMSKKLDLKAKVLTYSLVKPADIFLKDNQIYFKDNLLFSKYDLKLVGDHNLTNAMVAALMAYLAGIKTSDILEVIKSFQGVEHRLEFVCECLGVKYYNDSKSTNLESLIVALKAFSQPVILIAGGFDKGIDFSALENYQSKIKKAIFFGETKDKLASIITNNMIVNDVEEAVLLAKTISSYGDIVLFSPGCSSYDQFSNFEERGRFYKNIVNSLQISQK